MTFTLCCHELMMCSINLDESVTHVSKVARPSHLCVLFTEKLDNYLTVWITGARYTTLEASLLIAGARIETDPLL
jgi:hypothetical protein